MRPNTLGRPDDASREDRAQGRHDKAASPPTSPSRGEGRRKAAGGGDHICGVLKRHPTPELRSDPPPQGEGGCPPPPVSPHPEARAKRHRKNEGGWSSRPRSFEALAMRGRLRMRGIVWSLRHELHTAPNGNPPALVPKRKPSATHLPLEGRGRREAAGGVRPHLRYAHGSPHPGAPLRPSPSRGGWMPAADGQPLSRP
ncbi:hypothetical protein HNR26_000318 [Rhizobium rosettiformans]|uniref:Uncharacterized protein n=1 Tax=Rhizobium rosettiformans TaxID=1368430 RepID=A0A7W8HLH8_9HYPH|nr:hypothetical protein [Rhizobium rosettiformans]